MEELAMLVLQRAQGRGETSTPSKRSGLSGAVLGDKGRVVQAVVKVRALSDQDRTEASRRRIGWRRGGPASHVALGLVWGRSTP